MTIDASDLMLMRVLQLASPALPVGAYAYSQGLEWAVEAGWVGDEASLSEWLEQQLVHAVARLDLPVLVRLHAAAQRGDDAGMCRWSRVLLASRETSELVADDCNRGRALARLLRDLDVRAAELWVARDDAPFATLAAVAASAWHIAVRPTLLAYTWGWLENQVLSGVKLIPLGQVAGQRLVLTLAERIPDLCGDALDCDDDDIGGTLPMVAIASSRHETQYTRLFRS